ncbi:MAG TPA: PDZ domain-containing protein, partial [Planctomycetota bacterium]|nr:PDZ domain-containing protein [Planctomycetota bacterium]
PVDTVREVFEKELIQSFAAGGDAAWLGMQVQDSAGKVLVTAVEADGPAAQAGVAAGDVLARIGDTEVHSALDYARRVLTAAPARPFALQVLRGNRRLDLLPVPLSRAAGNLIAMTGLSFEEVTADQDRELLQKASRAFYKNSNLRRFPLAVLRVQHVQAGSPAADLGIEQGDVLLAVVGYDRFRGERELSLDSLHDFEQYLRQNQNGTVKVTILRGKELLDGQLDVRRLTKL